MGVKNIILDTTIINVPNSIVEYRYENSGVESNIFDENHKESDLLIGIPSISAAINILNYYDYDAKIIEPTVAIPYTTDTYDYRNGDRVTFICSKF
jgi:hypothetical protein